MIDAKLDGKVVVITGANNPYGIGAGVAKAVAAQGAKVFLHYFRPGSEDTSKGSLPDEAAKPGEAFYYAQQMKPPDEVLQAIRELDGSAQAWEADLSDPVVIPELFNQAENAFGQVDVLVNNAAHWEADTFLPSSDILVNKYVELWTSPPAGITARSFDRLFAVNTRAVALLTAEFARRHITRKASWGRIINVSTEGAHCFPSEISYGASKLALEGYTRSAALELGQFGITVNAVSLGPVQTGWITPELEKEMLPSIPLRRIGRPEDVADVIVFLASEQSRWLTGQKIYVGGGHAIAVNCC
jgi:3-oxoacyl-[acyl-carrier protein] reductase